MLRMAVVDNSWDGVEYMKDCIGEYFEGRARRKGWDYHISCHNSSQSLLEHFQPGKYDVLVSEVYMPYMTGIDLARRIRKLDPDIRIVFLTESKDHALDAYSVFADGYVVKTAADHKRIFMEALDRMLPEEADRAKKLPVRVAGQQTLSIPYHRVLYVDTGGWRGAVVHLCGQKIQTTNSYAELVEILSRDPRFLECYHRILINMDKVVRMEEDAFIMKNEVPIPISRRKRKEVRRAYRQYRIGK